MRGQMLIKPAKNIFAHISPRTQTNSWKENSNRQNIQNPFSEGKTRSGGALQ